MSRTAGPTFNAASFSRRILLRSAGTGAAAAAFGGFGAHAATASGLLDSAPEAPYESPITPERVAFLKTKPYRGKTINILVEKGSVGDGLKHHVPHWEEETGGRVSVAEVPIDILYTQIFSDLTSGLHRNDAYMTAAWFYGDFFTDRHTVHPADRTVPRRPALSVLEPRQLHSGDAPALYLGRQVVRRAVRCRRADAVLSEGCFRRIPTTRRSSRPSTATTCRPRRPPCSRCMTSRISSLAGTGTGTARTIGAWRCTPR